MLTKDEGIKKKKRKIEADPIGVLWVGHGLRIITHSFFFLRLS